MAGGVIWGNGGSSGAVDFGGVYKINLDGSGFTVLPPYAYFSSGGSPLLSVAAVFGYGCFGGSGQSLYRMNADGSGCINLHTFDGGSYSWSGSSDPEGAHPYGTPVLSGGMLYGATMSGGVLSNGVLFAMQTNGTGYTVLHTFLGGAGDGANPNTRLTVAGGKIYGLTEQGGVSNNGVLFSLNTNGTGFAVLHTFTGNVGDGAGPVGALALSGSTLFGATSDGGVSNWGTVFALDITADRTQTIVTGAVNPDKAGSVSGSGVYEIGSNVTLTAVASNSWQFIGWNDGSTNNPYSFVAPQLDATYTANPPHAHSTSALFAACLHRPPPP